MTITRNLAFFLFLMAITAGAAPLTGVFTDVAPKDHSKLIEKSKTESVLVLYYLPDCHICHSVEEKLAELSIDRGLHQRIYTMDATNFDDAEIEVLPVIRIYNAGKMTVSKKGRTLGLQVKSLLGKLAK